MNLGEVDAMKPAVQFQDGKGRNLEATIQGDVFEWKLWVNDQTKDAVVSQQSKAEQARYMHRLTIPAGVVDYQNLLQSFVDKQPKNNPIRGNA
jgi:hypothetical protein